MCRIRTRLPFAVQLPADGRFELTNYVPNFDGAHRIATDERECGEEVNTEDLVPKLGNRMLRIGGANGFLRRWIDLELATGQTNCVQEETKIGQRTVDVICNLPNLANFVKNTGSRETCSPTNAISGSMTSIKSSIVLHRGTRSVQKGKK